MSLGIRIRQATSATELDAIYQFRYSIYVEEMARKQKYADHQRKRIEDPLDAAAINLGAWQDARLVGVVRMNFPRAGDISPYEDFYAMGSVAPEHPNRTSICTRLMVQPDLRNSRLAAELAIRCYCIALENDIAFNFIDCNDHLVRFFLGLGYISHVPQADHEEYGFVTRLRLDLHDEAHLGSVRSPFLRHLRLWKARYNQPLPAVGQEGSHL